ncbi:hypothetical protein PSTEL_07015 [Paenibacillus stellifer]|uniref:Uncharacterized protein n=1 Tax=Paenibacillus stellifer TaxID=169760 RepID=A0A089LUN3_9BACL|nr:hypothetical protein [Paenibacillus stellifer]AIQ62893.1 hypothetical protein PSTEL_07015 [Paenibacillus stellifer]
MISQRVKNSSYLLLSIMLTLAAGWYFFYQSYEVKSNINAPQPSSIADEKVVSTEGLYITYSNVDALEEHSDLILTGTPVSDFKDREHVTTTYGDGNIQEFYTLTDLKVTSVLKKPADLDLVSGQTFQVAEPVGYTDTEKKDTKITRNEYSKLKKDSEYVIFLKKNDQGQYFVLNLNLGKFNLNGNSEIAPDSKSMRIEEKASESEYQTFLNSVISKYKLKLKK